MSTLLFNRQLATLFIAVLTATACGPRPGAAPAPMAGLETPQLVSARHYLAGIQALEKGEYNQAMTALSQALEGDPDNEEYVRARGVAETLAEQFPAALRDLERARRLDPRDPEARLWLATAYRMSGDPGRGASLFMFDPRIPKTYTELVYDQMAMAYWTSTQQGRYFDRRTQEFIQTKGPQRRDFAEAALLYAQRHKPSGPAATQLVSRGVDAKLAAGDFAGAQPDLLILLANRPGDVEVQKQWTACLVGLKNHRAARAQATYVLGIDPLWSEGYLLRAEAAAHLGDTRRARADLDIARRLDPQKTATVQPRVEPLLVAKAPDTAAADFAQAVKSGAPWDQLVPLAVQTGRWFELHRARYDEVWQERLWLLAEARRIDPKNPDRAEMLARYLLNTIVVPRIWDGPRAEPLPLRRQNSKDQEREAHESVQLCDEALKLDPKHVPAMATKAALLFKMGNLSGAENLVKQGLAIEPDSVPLLELNADCLDAESVAVAAPSIGLRAGHTSVHYENRSDGRYRVETHYGPTAAETAEANGLISEATAIRQEGMAAVAHARSVKQQRIQSLVNQAQRAYNRKESKAAETTCRQALRLWPDNSQAQTLLAEIMGLEGRFDDQRIFSDFSRPIPNTSAAVELKKAWADIERTAFQSAEAALEQGFTVDPTDARLLACRNVIAEGRNNEPEAERWRQGALALEEARARAEGTSYQASAKAPLTLRDVGLILLLSQESAMAQWQSDPQRALQMEQGICALEQRLPKASLFQRLPSGMLPDPNTEPGHIPEAPSLATMFAWAHLRAGQALLALHRPAEARAELERVQVYAHEWPMTQEGRNTLDEVQGWACLEQIKLAMAENHLDDALVLLTHCGGGGGRKVEAAKAQLTEELYRRRQQQEQATSPWLNPKARERLSEWQKLKLRREGVLPGH